jgi:hypothetical protein
MHRLSTPFLALAAAACLGSAAFAQTVNTAPKPAPGTVITDEAITGPRTGTTGTGNSSGQRTIIRTHPPAPVNMPGGGTVSPSAGTTERTSNSTGIVPPPTTTKSSVTGGVTGN